jgi:hypothetical protein
MTLSDRELDRRLAALPRHTETPSQHWQVIAARLDTPARRWPPMATAAIGIAACLALALLVVDPDAGVHSDTAAFIVATEIQAMRTQASGIEQSGGRLTTEMSGAWEQNQDAIDELEHALARHPDNPMLIDFLAQARLRQHQLIQQAKAGGALADYRSQHP